MTESSPSGEIFGRYLLSHRLGSGGMGIVHAATWIGPEGVARAVCVKRIRAGSETSVSRIRRFVDEARLSMGLSHGNVVQTLDFGRVGDEYFLALELVDGTDLGTLLASLRRDGVRMRPDVAALIAAAISDGLAYAHGRGVVHRDVKPGNVLLSRAGEIKIADFGVAALAAAGARDVQGTAAYMAPEQARGEAVDARADLYGVGLVLFEMLAGHAARGGGDEAAIRARAKEGRIPPLEDAPDALVRIVEHATQADRAHRPADAREVADALGAFVASARARADVPPARWLASEVDRIAAQRIASTSSASTTGSGTDGRPSTYFTRDGGDDEFLSRLAETRVEVPRRKMRAWPAVVTAALLAAAAGWALRQPTPTRPVRSVRVATQPTTPVRTEPSRPASIAREPESARPEAPRPRAVRPIRPIAVAATTEPTTPAMLDVNARPYATVEIDGIRRGETPLLGLSLPPGEHVIRLVHPASGRESTRRVALSPGERRTVTADLRGE